MSVMKMYEIHLTDEDYEFLEEMCTYDYTLNKSEWLRGAIDDLSKALFWYASIPGKIYQFDNYMCDFGPVKRRMTIYLSPVDISNLEYIAEICGLPLRNNMSKLFRIIIRDAYSKHQDSLLETGGVPWDDQM